MTEEQRLVLQCHLCDYQAETLGDLANHPCRRRLLARQKERARVGRHVNLDDFLFCPVCGSGRLKQHEEKRRAGGFSLVPRDHCLMCWTNYDQDWGFLDQVYCFRADEALALRCPAPGCPGEFHTVCDDLRPSLEWSSLRGKPSPCVARKKLERRCSTCGALAPAHLLLGAPENRLRILAAVTTRLRSYESEQLLRLRDFDPHDPRVSQEAWIEWEATCQQREERYRQEVKHVRGEGEP